MQFLDKDVDLLIYCCDINSVCNKVKTKHRNVKGAHRFMLEFCGVPLKSLLANFTSKNKITFNICVANITASC